MDTIKLAPNTKAVWEILQNEPTLRGFVLIGGTALTLRMGHRISEDLDFSYPADGKLPRQQVDNLIRRIKLKGCTVEPIDNARAVEEALNDGLDFFDYQRDFKIDGVKVTLYAPESETAKLLQPADVDAPLRVATLDEIFDLKCLACADRGVTRDWFDLYTMMTRYDYKIAMAYAMFQRIGVPQKFDIFESRLRTCRPLSDDSGYLHLLDEDIPLEVMKTYFGYAITNFHAEYVKKKTLEMAKGMQLTQSDSAKKISDQDKGP